MAVEEAVEAAAALEKVLVNTNLFSKSGRARARGRRRTDVLYWKFSTRAPRERVSDLTRGTGAQGNEKLLAPRGGG